MDFIILLFLFFTFLGVLLSLLFFLRKKGDKTANILIGVYTLLFSFELLNNCLRWSGKLNTETFVHLNLAHFPLWPIYGALVYIYTRQVIKKTGIKINDLVFLIPSMVIIIMLFPFYHLSSTQKLNVVLEGSVYEYAYFPKYAIWIIILIMFLYAFYTYFQFWGSKQSGFRENRWLKWFVGSYFGFVFAFFSYIFLVRFQLMDAKYDYFVDIIIVAFIGLLSFFGFVQPDIFEGKSLKEIIPFIKYKKTGLSKALSIEMKEKLLSIMEEKKPYLDNQLRLDDLSKDLNLSRNHTSQIVNEHFNLSFFDFINKYRIEEAKTLLLNNSNEHSTITQIAYDVGFNNRASFYKAFKKFTNTNPSEYLVRKEAV